MNTRYVLLTALTGLTLILIAAFAEADQAATVPGGTSPAPTAH